MAKKQRKLQDYSTKQKRAPKAKGKTIPRVAGCDRCCVKLNHDCGRDIGSIMMAPAEGVYCDRSKLKFYCSPECRDEDV